MIIIPADLTMTMSSVATDFVQFVKIQEKVAALLYCHSKLVLSSCKWDKFQ